MRDWGGRGEEEEGRRRGGGGEGRVSRKRRVSRESIEREYRGRVSRERESIEGEGEGEGEGENPILYLSIVSKRDPEAL